MDVEIIKAIGEYILTPICITATVWLVFNFFKNF